MTPPKTEFSGHELSAKSGVEVVSLLKKGEVSPKDLIGICEKRLSVVEPTVNACPVVCRDRASTATEKRDNQDLKSACLAGIPINIKDLSGVSGVRSTWGTKALADFVPDQSDPIVTHLEDHGGVVLAKTNTPEFGAGANTFNAVFGATLNPWNTSRNAAGSSGGAAVSLATGTFWFAHGSDHAGSLRTPAAYCGVVGMRPSPGLVPSGGAPNFSRTGVQGPMARSVEDVAYFLDAMTGFDASSPISFPPPEEPFERTTKHDKGPWKIAYSPTLNGYGPVENNIRAVLDAAMTSAEKNGATVEDACPDLSHLETTYRVLRGLMWVNALGKAPASMSNLFKDTLKENIAFGRALSIEDISKASENRSALFAEMVRFLSTYDVLATTVVGCAPKAIEIEYPNEVAGEPMDDYISWLKFAFLSTTTGLPSISVPVGFTEDGLPVGIQLIGAHRGEAKLLQIARFIEKSAGFPIGPIDPIIKSS